MYAVVRTGGKQYRVQAGDVLKVEKLEQDLGAEFDLTDVLMVGEGSDALVGTPHVNGAKVRVVVTKQARKPKILVFKKKRRQGYRRTQGHKQYFTELFVKSILHPNGQEATTTEVPNVKDVAKVRKERIEAKVAAHKELVQSLVGKGASAKKASLEAPVKAAKAKKKTSKKAAAKKPAAKKAKATKKVAKKKVSKKANK